MIQQPLLRYPYPDHNDGALPPAIRLFEDEVIVDEFAGGGGASTGIEWAIGRSPDVAINHNLEALAMHKRNHPRTHHIPTDVYRVDPVDATGGRPCAFAWFSPDCTYFSKARGSKPFRDPRWARRVRGLAWVVVKWARAPLPVKPRMMFIENVEEFQFWGALRADGTPDPKKRGRNFRRWKRAIEAEGFVVEFRELRADEYGAPTRRKRLFIICRRDGHPIVWPEPTHGPQLVPYRTAAECIDWNIPVPSIFLTPAQAKKWAKKHGVATPKRPLVNATKRRIARGVMRYVVKHPKPFVVPVDGGLLASMFVGVGGRKAQSAETRPDQPYHTITSKNDTALVTAFLAKHNGGHEATGQHPTEPIDTITCGGNGGGSNKSIVTATLVHLRGSDTVRIGARDVREPVPAITANGRHIALVYAFLVKWFGTKKDGITLDRPLDTITTKERYGLVTVTVDGETYAIVDIGMRILSPREQFRCQGFPNSYVIHEGLHPVDLTPIKFTKKTQNRLVGNSVPPHLSCALVRANLLSVGGTATAVG